MTLSDKKLQNVVVKHKGNMSAAARSLGRTPQAISKRVAANPELKESIKQMCLKNLEKAGASIDKIFQRTAEGLDAVAVTESGQEYPNFKERRESAKLCHTLVGTLSEQDKDNGLAPQVVVMPVIVLNGKPLSFDIGTNE